MKKYYMRIEEVELVFDVKLSAMDLGKLTKNIVMDYDFFESATGTNCWNVKPIDEKVFIVRNDDDIENGYSKYWICFKPSYNMNIDAVNFSRTVEYEMNYAENWFSDKYEIEPEELRIRTMYFEDKI